METEEKRQHEIRRYEQAYEFPQYGMGQKRQLQAARILKDLPNGSLLDVGAGRGEGIEIARMSGHNPVMGIEPVPYLADGETILGGVATDIPFATESFDTVMCLDVLEHLIPEDVEPALIELRRVASKFVFLTASDQPHNFKHLGDMHISKRPINEWQELFDKVFIGSEIKFLGKIGVSPGWLIRL